MARIPAKSVSASDRDALRTLERDLRLTIFGQDRAIEALGGAIKMARSGLRDEEKPIGAFLFAGPTGVGKTELTKALANFMFDTDEAMVRLDMSEFMEKHSVARLIGAPPGYVGFEEGGYLTEAVRRKPYAVVLFDEIEKADTQVFDTLLRFADEGIIDDPAGPVRDGTRCIIVMTTNAGQSWLRQHLKTNPDARQDPDTLSTQLFDAAMKELEEKSSAF